MSRDVPVVGDDGRRKLLEREVAAPAGRALPSADSSQLCTSRGIISYPVCCRGEKAVCNVCRVFLATWRAGEP